MSFSGLRDIFSGRYDANYCVKSLLFLKSPNNVKEYLTGIHKVVFPTEDKRKNERWDRYPSVKGTPVIIPIGERHLSNPVFMNKQADRLSFDISRFIEFLSGYAKVDDDIKPIMLHYAMIYLLDFFTRTWLKYGQNWGHGIELKPRGKGSSVNEYPVQIKKKGIFPRAVDAFYFCYQSSLFSRDDDDGVGYMIDPFTGGTLGISARIEKMKYSETPKIKLNHLVSVYEKLGKIVGSVSKSNHILVGYVILFIMSSISRYRAEDWFKIRENRNLKNKFELLQHDFIYEWIPEILMQTILKDGLEKELSISSK